MFQLTSHQQISGFPWTRANIALVWVVVCLMALPVATTAVAVDGIALLGGTAITSTGSEPVEDAVILVRDGRIEQVGKRKSIEIPDGYQLIDTTGRWITPGLVETNTHLILTTVPEFFVKYEDRLEDIALQSAQVALKYGMTTIADSWGPVEPLLTVRNRINSGEVVGTRALIGGNIIGMGGPFSHYMMTGWPVTNKGMRYGGWVHPEIQGRINALWEAGVGPSLLAAEPEEVSEIMREYIARGVDFIKVAVSGHALGDVEPLMFEMAALKAMKEETRRAGIPFTTHTFTNASLRVAIELEPDLLVHPNVMSIPYAYSTPRQQEAFEKLAKLASQKKIHSALMMIPSKAQTEIVMNWDPEAHRESPGVNELIWNRKLHTSYESYEKISQGVKVWLDAGVPYTIATDQGPESTDVGPTVWGRLGRAHFDRMEALQALGEDPADILIAATRNGAAAYNLDDRLGTLETGKIADILILDANPHEDIANLRKINTIIKDGRIIDRDDLPEVKVLDYDPEATWPY